jgi:hypothetical protein
MKPLVDERKPAGQGELRRKADRTGHSIAGEHSPFSSRPQCYPDLSSYSGLRQDHIDWLLKLGVDIETMIRPAAMLLAYGHKAHDGRFEEGGQVPWLVFPEPEDCIYWQPRTGDLTTWNGRAFALGEGLIYQPETYAFDCSLNIFASPLEWLQAKRDGIVVLDWSRAFDQLRECPRIAVSEAVLFQYRRHMKPGRLPELFVIPKDGMAAALPVEVQFPPMSSTHISASIGTARTRRSRSRQVSRRASSLSPSIRSRSARPGDIWSKASFPASASVSCGGHRRAARASGRSTW